MKGAIAALTVNMFALLAIEDAVNTIRRQAHMGYFSLYGAVQWGLVLVGAVLLAVAISLKRSR